MFSKIAVMKLADLADLSQPGTVGINPILSDLNTPTLQNWYVEANYIDRNELQLSTAPDSQKFTKRHRNKNG